jgi:hypothetical protein
MLNEQIDKSNFFGQAGFLKIEKLGKTYQADKPVFRSLWPAVSLFASLGTQAAAKPPSSMC